AWQYFQEGKGFLSEEEKAQTRGEVTRLETAHLTRLSILRRRLPRLVRFMHHDKLVASAFDPRGGAAVTVGEDQLVRLWNLEGGGMSQWKVADLTGEHHADQPSEVNHVCLSPGGQLVVLCSGCAGAKRGQACVWDPARPGKVPPLQHEGRV